MCGIFGCITNTKIIKSDLKNLINHSEQRGKDSSGLVIHLDDKYLVKRADFRIKKLWKETQIKNSKLICGHSRLITNGLSDNQPINRNGIIVIHNGIVVNDEEIWAENNFKRYQKIDTEIIAALAEKYLSENDSLDNFSEYILSYCKGVVACAIVIPKIGKLILFSNNGSLYIGEKNNFKFFASERYGLEKNKCKKVTQIINSQVVWDIPNNHNIIEQNYNVDRKFKLPMIDNKIYKEAEILEYNNIDLKRCKKCVLPETMPFIEFDKSGVCNYCNSYKKRNIPKPKEELFKLVEPYRRPGNELDCIIPFSGGRDSSYGLHLVVNELKMKPLSYTYDWGMVTDLGRRNISRVCSKLGIENIIVAADIEMKRKNIRKNLVAWLKQPHLGLIALLTAGDKHFFRYVEKIKKQTGISLNLWSVNPMEITHFKGGFLGISPDFGEDKVYSNGVLNQLNYHSKRFKAMLQGNGYFNSSLWDTLSGEYFRSFLKKEDYFHTFDYWTWDENIVNKTLIDEYEWELAVDTPTTWRIGDATAAFYNYVYMTVAGFTEHDTFRSNQIREGQLSRDEALKLLSVENMPRYQNIKWYLECLDLDFKEVIKIINGIPKLYSKKHII